MSQPDTIRDSVRRIRVAGYLILTITGAIPLLDFLAGVLPPQIGVVTWRFGFEGLAANAVTVPVAMLFLFLLLAQLAGDRRIKWVVVVLALVAAVSTLVFLASFSLDAIQIRKGVPPTAIRRFTLSTVMAWFKLLFHSVACWLLTLAALRAIRAERQAPRASGTHMVMPSSVPTRTGELPAKP